MTRYLKTKTQQKGATLVELVMTIVIISVAIAGVVGAFATITGRSADPLNHTRAVELAQLYLDEIIAKKYAHETPPGGEPAYRGDEVCNIGLDDGETRASYNDVDDYDTIEGSVPKGADDNELNGYNGFLVSVTVDCAGGEVDMAGVDAKRIDLTITAPGGQSFLFSAYRANF